MLNGHMRAKQAAAQVKLEIGYFFVGVAETKLLGQSPVVPELRINFTQEAFIRFVQHEQRLGDVVVDAKLRHGVARREGVAQLYKKFFAHQSSLLIVQYASSPAQVKQSCIGHERFDFVEVAAL